ncbi:hypothetical protein C361_03897 [Cryptococcus neoformans Tu259-1]|uniref:Uncharacterized protein n=1 Tax=Cryptococcus neoformans Tu259-1 TaxID=1230072 RepID=A0A854QBN9_CRYNE|nr:hypothetical protein C353_03594 [Cryptococcus neoformans var. grubii AD1-83a]OXG19837.1 hypothetical protein C361_03897 [Cryptococcus neoformans var. grubii Tu259-1]OXG58269.1 hypothetical protein C354_03531 [Cryptococcus neoformans var. grubii MW-RSA1955]OXG62649.1 hypothetical protein C352_03542 [Cryptococcus neoformans var. grubii CHC193]OXG63086.1 hypothetical protein C351_03318 [Cryptococcus neoformans var. grubii c8]OXH09855.1 hypothetical protein C369_03569 [Cryptococcus neoformans v
MTDPNFPPNLDIKPLLLTHHHPHGQVQSDNQTNAIAAYGIAGRIWEATKPLLDYFTPSQAYEPPCSLFASRGPHCVVELGSGQSVASLHLAAHLAPQNTIVLTDLPAVIPLCEKCIDSWRPPKCHAKVVARPLAWGQTATHLREEFGPISHVLMCDLIYFPHLYPLLLYTLLSLTEPSSVADIEDDTFGPEVIISYTTRTLALEESFFDALAHYFKTTPVRGGTWEAKVFIGKRWKVTKDWSLPDIKDVMNGSKEVIRGRSYGLIDELFGTLDW